MILRPATPQDEPLLFELFAAEKVAEFAAIGLTEAQYRPLLEMQYRARAIGYSEQHPGAKSWIIVLEQAAEVTSVGQYLLVKTPQGSRIVDLAVLPQYRGQRIATQVLQQLAQQSAAAGEVLSLRVMKGNQAIRLYARLGFDVVNEDEISYEMLWHFQATNEGR
jgi:ribosomal protein S18 acetylase RimI-like enzyme